MEAAEKPTKDSMSIEEPATATGKKKKKKILWKKHRWTRSQKTLLTKLEKYKKMCIRCKRNWKNIQGK